MKKYLVEARVPAKEMLTQRSQTHEQNHDSEQLADATLERSGGSVFNQNHRDRDEHQANSRVCLHRYPGGINSFEGVAAEYPAKQPGGADCKPDRCQADRVSPKVIQLPLLVCAHRAVFTQL